MTKTDRFTIPVGIFIMIRQEDKILLQLRQNCSFSGYYGFVGGHLDGQESIVSAAIREVHEEIGISINPNDLILKTICHSNQGKEYLQFYFECSKWSGNIENKEPEKCAKLEWHNWDNLPVNCCPYIYEAVNKIKNSIAFYEDKF